MIRLSTTEQIEYFRKERERICFPIINRGKLWYDTLTSEQYLELKRWYEDWLNVTETLKVPATPKWVYEKVEKEEILY